jgi:hypothetical protein
MIAHMTTVQTLELGVYFAAQFAFVVLSIRWIFSH